MGRVDRFIRIGLGGFLLALGAARMTRHGTLGGAATGLLGGMLLAEGVLGSCPYYNLLGTDTRTPLGTDVLVDHTVTGPAEGI